jgi:alpha-tubulin suppressor-like RCC1 family protein
MNAYFLNADTVTRLINIKIVAMIAAVFAVFFSLMASESVSAQSATDLSTGTATGCAVTNNKVKCWGSGSNGVLGNGSTSNVSTPVNIKEVSKITVTQKIADGYCMGGTIKVLGNEICIGVNVHARTVNVDSNGLAGKSVSKVSVGRDHACAIANARVYCWGSDSRGQLGTYSGSSTNSTPTAVYAGAARTISFPRTQWQSEQTYQLNESALRNKEIIDVSAGNGFTCALASDGVVACWGRNDRGQLGIGNKNDKDVPVAVNSGALSGKKVRSLATVKGDAASMCAITAEERAVCWGRNDFGEVGNGDPIPSTLTKVSGTGTHTNKNRCDVTNKQALTSIKKNSKITLQQDEVLRPANVDTNLKFTSIEIVGRGDSVVTIDNNFNPGDKEGITTFSGKGYTYVTAKTSGSSQSADRAYYWGGSFLYDFIFDCESNNDYNDNDGSGGDGGTNEGTDTTAKIEAYQFGRSVPTGPLYTAAGANQLRNQSLAAVSGNAFTGSNYEQYKQCLSRQEFVWFSWKTVTTCGTEPSEDGCAVTRSQQDAAYCNTGKTCTAGSLFQAQSCSSGSTNKVPSGSGSWLQSGMKIVDMATGVSDFNCALANGSVGCWGNNGSGQLGDGTKSSKATPVKVKL